MSAFEDLFGVERHELTIENFKEFIAREPEETMHLEFKSGDTFSSGDRGAITKAVSSFANSDGGILIIGVKEIKMKGISHAGPIDGVKADAKHSKEALENVIVSGISPRIAPLYIVRLDEDGKSIFILDIPKSGRAPHMASDKRYYRRQNFQKVPMEHYEVEDYLFGRRSTPRLTAKFSLSLGKLTRDALRFSMEILLRNHGKSMARYVLFTLQIKGMAVTLPPPSNCQVLKNDPEETILQFGPFSNGVAPVVVPPSPSDQEIWMSLGAITLKMPNLPQLKFISYRIMHQELPVTDGQFTVDANVIANMIAIQSMEVNAPNENISY